MNFKLIIVSSIDSKIKTGILNAAKELFIDVINISSISDTSMLDINSQYLLYCINTDNFNSLEIENYIKKNYFIISYPKGIYKDITNNKNLKQYAFPKIWLTKDTNLESSIVKLGGFPLMLNKFNSYASNGKTLITNLQQLKNLIEKINLNEGYQLYKYIEHDINLRIFLVNNSYADYYISRKHDYEFTTNRIDDGDKKKDFHNTPYLNKKFIELAKEYMIHELRETAGVDIMISNDNKIYLLETNYPCNFHLNNTKVNFKTIDIAKKIILGLQSKYIELLPKMDKIKSYNNPDLILPEKTQEFSWFNEIKWFAKYCNINIKFIDSKSNVSDINHNYINLFSENYIYNKLKHKNNIYGLNNINLKIRSKYIWNKIKVTATGDKLVGNYFKHYNFNFPIILYFRKDLCEAKFSANTPREAISLITTFQNLKYTCYARSAINPINKRILLMIGSDIIEANEYIDRGEDILDLYNSQTRIRLDFKKISHREKEIITKIANKNKIQGLWVLKYYLDVELNMFIEDFYLSPNIDFFLNKTGDLLISKCLINIYNKYHNKDLLSVSQNEISQYINAY